MLPLGAIVVAIFAVAVPVILLLAVWAGVTAFRILFPDEPLPFAPAPQRRVGHGEGVPVRLRDIVENERARQAVAATERTEPAPDGSRPAKPRPHPLFEDLWLRRN